MNKRLITLIVLAFFYSITSYGQQKTYKEKYIIKANQAVHFKIKDTVVTYKKGWVITETINGKLIQREIIKEKEVDSIKVDSIVKLKKTGM